MMQRNSGGRDGGGAMAKSSVFIGGSKPKPTAFAAAAGSAYWGEKTTSGIRYRECLKNHAAAMGGSVTDGCGEFMPSGEDGSLEAFKCAACSCHRNFHRQEVVAENNRWTSPLVHPAMMSFDGGVGRGSAATDSSIKELKSFNVYQSSGAGNHHRTSSMVQPVMMSFGGGGGRGSTVTDSFNVFQSADTGNHHSTSSMAHPMIVSFGGSGGGRGSAATDSFTKELKSFNVYQSSGAGNQHSN